MFCKQWFPARCRFVNSLAPLPEINRRGIITQLMSVHIKPWILHLMQVHESAMSQASEKTFGWGQSHILYDISQTRTSGSQGKLLGGKKKGNAIYWYRSMHAHASGNVFPYTGPMCTGWSNVHWHATGLPQVDPLYTGIPLETVHWRWNCPTLDCQWKNSHYCSIYCNTTERSIRAHTRVTQ